MEISLTHDEGPSIDNRILREWKHNGHSREFYLPLRSLRSYHLLREGGEQEQEF